MQLCSNPLAAAVAAAVVDRKEESTLRNRDPTHDLDSAREIFKLTDDAELQGIPHTFDGNE